MKTTLIIAIPNRMLAQMLATYIESQDENISVCGIATDTRMIFLLLAQCHPSLLIYDPSLSGPGPEVVCSRLRTDFPGLKCILMKNPNTNGRYGQAQNCSPAATISSDANPDELLELVKSVHRPQYIVNSKKASTDNRPSTTLRVTPATEHRLSPREIEVAEQIAKGLCAKAIAARLHISENTVRNHRQNMLTKLKFTDKTQLVLWYLGRAA